MPKHHIVVRTPLSRSARVKQMEGMFDLPAVDHDEYAFDAQLPDTNQEWQIGLIVGPSGSGKTSLVKEAYGDRVVQDYEWGESVIDSFPKSCGIKYITGALSSVGFSSPPAWRKPFSVLSTGEQFRATIARALCESEDMVVVDEFTSVVDRRVAQIGSAAIAKHVRRGDKRFVAVTCHYDVEQWLCPDWTLDLSSQELYWRSLQRPDIEIEIRRCHRRLWEQFRRHHYLSHDITISAQCFVGQIDGVNATFVAVRHYPHPSRPGWHEHRTVVKPDFQGIGIGNTVSEYVASLFAATGKPYRSTTSHPAMIHHRARWQT